MVTSIGTTYSWFVWNREKNDISPAVLYEDNSTRVTQMSNGYVIGNLTKHIAPKFFYPHELQKNGVIIIVKVRYSDYLANLFTKSLPTSTFEKYIYGIGMSSLGLVPNNHEN